MGKFIELTYLGGRKFYLNVDKIYRFVWDEEYGNSDIYTFYDDEPSEFVRETPAEIMEKIREVQNEHTKHNSKT